MIEEIYQSYRIKAFPIRTASGRWTVAVEIGKESAGDWKTQRFMADDKIEYILEIEAEKESINLGRNLINHNRIRF